MKVDGLSGSFKHHPRRLDGALRRLSTRTSVNRLIGGFFVGLRLSFVHQGFEVCFFGWNYGLGNTSRRFPRHVRLFGRGSVSLRCISRHARILRTRATTVLIGFAPLQHRVTRRPPTLYFHRPAPLHVRHSTVRLRLLSVWLRWLSVWKRWLSVGLRRLPVWLGWPSVGLRQLSV